MVCGKGRSGVRTSCDPRPESQPACLVEPRRHDKDPGLLPRGSSCSPPAGQGAVPAKRPGQHRIDRGRQRSPRRPKSKCGARLNPRCCRCSLPSIAGLLLLLLRPKGTRRPPLAEAPVPECGRFGVPRLQSMGLGAPRWPAVVCPGACLLQLPCPPSVRYPMQCGERRRRGKRDGRKRGTLTTTGLDTCDVKERGGQTSGLAGRSNSIDRFDRRPSKPNPNKANRHEARPFPLGEEALVPSCREGESERTKMRIPTQAQSRSRCGGWWDDGSGVHGGGPPAGDRSFQRRFGVVPNRLERLLAPPFGS